MHRRHLFTLVPATAAVVLAGCSASGQQTAVTAQQSQQLQALIAGAQSIESSLSTNVPLLLGAVKLSAGDQANVRTALAALVQATNALAQAPTLTAGTPYVQTIESTLNTIVTVAASLPIVPEPYHTALVVAALALPPVEALVGLAVQQGTALYVTIQARKVQAAPVAAS